MMTCRNIFLITICAGALALASCNYRNSDSPMEEGPYCDLNFSYSDAVTITGSAVYNVRSKNTVACGLGAESYGGPIRRAEVQVIQGDKFVQCGHTDDEGRFSVKIPPNQSVVIRVTSRANNAYLKASVLEAPTNNFYYALAKNIDTGSEPTKDIGQFVAHAHGSQIIGGAFNILDDLLKANESLRYLVCGTSVTTTCDEFSVAPKVTAFWKAGANPITYFNGDPNQGLSFYVMGTRKLYILGGVNGNTTTADTDHFDDSVIIHEYGHFIEDVFGKSDSPGGTHDGNHVLDARLVWSEGWANFFSSAARANKIYRDTYGNSDGATGCFFDYDIEKNETSTGLSLDVPSTTGEGVFREFAITRALWDGVDPLKNSPTGTPDGADGGAGDDDSTDAVNQTTDNMFYKYWINIINRWANNSYHFRSAGLFFELLNDGTMNNIYTAQKMRSDRTDYAKPLPTSGGGCNIVLDAVDSACVLGGRLVCLAGDRHSCCSHQLKSNDFYYFYHDGSQSSIAITQAATNIDLDLYLYKEGYSFGSDSTDAILKSNSTSKNASISLAGLPVGPYLVNVSAKTTSNSDPSAATYRISVSGTKFCT